MEAGRVRRCGSPERSKAPPAPKSHHRHLSRQSPLRHRQRERKTPVVYYLCRNRHLEHPHFIEVPAASAKEGLYLRDFVNRLNALRGKGMAAMYSWSCKRSYKNGFVWHDLSEDDPILPSSHGNEYVLKGSELLDPSLSDGSTTHRATWSSQPITTKQHLRLPARSEEATGAVIKEELKQPQHPPPPPPGPEDETSELSPGRSFSSRTVSPDTQQNPPSWGGGSAGAGGGSSPEPPDYQVQPFKADGGTDASTQTEDTGRRSRRWKAGPMAAGPAGMRTMGVSTDEGASCLRLTESSEMSGDEVSPPPTSPSASSSGGKTETLESLIIGADAGTMKAFRVLEEDREVLDPAGVKLRATNVLMQLITCGSISVKDRRHSIGFVPTNKPRFPQVIRFPSPVFSSSRLAGEVDCPSGNPRMVGLRLEEKEYFSGSLIETRKHREVEGVMVPSTLKRSSSYNAERSSESPELTGSRGNPVESAARSKCLPRTLTKLTTPTKQPAHPKSETETAATARFPVSRGPRISSADGSSVSGSRRLADASSAKGSSKRLEPFGTEEEEVKIIKIEESLLRELGL